MFVSSLLARQKPRRNELRNGVDGKRCGGDVTRKLLDKQKEDKRRMLQFGQVDILHEAVIAALKVDV
jgi:translation elongation factor EF-4